MQNVNVVQPLLPVPAPENVKIVTDHGGRVVCPRLRLQSGRGHFPPCVRGGVRSQRGRQSVKVVQVLAAVTSSEDVNLFRSLDEVGRMHVARTRRHAFGVRLQPSRLVLVR